MGKQAPRFLQFGSPSGLELPGVKGVIVKVRENAGASPLPFNHVVLSANSEAAAQLLQHALRVPQQLVALRRGYFKSAVDDSDVETDLAIAASHATFRCDGGARVAVFAGIVQEIVHSLFEKGVIGIDRRRFQNLERSGIGCEK